MTSSQEKQVVVSTPEGRSRDTVPGRVTSAGEHSTTEWSRTSAMPSSCAAWSRDLPLTPAQCRRPSPFAALRQGTGEQQHRSRLPVSGPSTRQRDRLACRPNGPSRAAAFGDRRTHRTCLGSGTGAGHGGGGRGPPPAPVALTSSPPCRAGIPVAGAHCYAASDAVVVPASQELDPGTPRDRSPGLPRRAGRRGRPHAPRLRVGQAELARNLGPFKSERLDLNPASDDRSSLSRRS
jgi:hypothetical protein